MSVFDVFKRVSQAPTNPKPAAGPRQFDVADLYAGPVDAGVAGETGGIALDEKL
ncbi:MAG: hypothetical protein MZW92_81750 [Comamonadaceae bacterium]|nr:hypothetical protein [Comamonadaceae bacterium]